MPRGGIAVTELRSIMVDENELRILSSLREMPEGKLKELHESFLLELSNFLLEPKCAQVQADGYPCGSSSADCESCLKLEELLSTLRKVLPSDL